MSASFSMRDAGTRLLLRGRSRLAASMLRRAADADPTDADARHNLALALRAEGDLQGALAACADAQTPEGRTLLGSLRLQLGDAPGGEAALQQAADAGHAPARYLLGLRRWAQDRRDDAAALLRAAQHGPLRALAEAHLADLLAGAAPPPADLPLAAEVRAAPPDAVPARGAEALTADGLSALLARSRHAVALTGAGLAASRRRQLWEQLHRDEAVGVWRFRESPVYLWSVIAGALDGDEAAPSAAHRALAKMPLAAVLTQGVGGLHQQAGSAAVVELHGALTRTRCDQCGRAYRVPVQGYIGGPLPPRCACGGPIRPDVVLFGEAPAQEAVEAARRALAQADLLLVSGCAADAAPVPALLREAAARGVRVVEVPPAVLAGWG